MTGTGSDGSHGAARTWRAMLRDGTSSAHLSVEKVWSTADGFQSVAHYRDFLNRVLAAHRDFGMRAACTVGSHEDRDDEQRRIDAVCGDLAREVPSPDAPAPMTEGYAWGVGYVLNGSALGASMMLREGHVQPDWPVRYLETCRDYALSGRLKGYFDRMNRADLDPEDALRGATDAFSIFGNPVDAPPAERP